MRWRLGRRSQNIEDRRGMSPTRGFPMPSGFPMPGGIPTSRGARRGGLGGLALLLLLLLGFCYGFDPGVLLQGDSVTNLPYETAPQVPPSTVDDEMGDTGVDWEALDPRRYDPRRIVREALLDDPPAAKTRNVPPRRPAAASPAATPAPTVAGAAMVGEVVDAVIGCPS